MSERKIDLEEIIRKHVFSENDYIKIEGDFREQERYKYPDISFIDCKLIMLEFGNQLLELAVKNVLLDKYLNGKFQDSSYRYLNNQGYSININKQSITDTINQVI